MPGELDHYRHRRPEFRQTTARRPNRSVVVALRERRQELAPSWAGSQEQSAHAVSEDGCREGRSHPNRRDRDHDGGDGQCPCGDQRNHRDQCALLYRVSDRSFTSENCVGACGDRLVARSQVSNRAATAFGAVGAPAARAIGGCSTSYQPAAGRNRGVDSARNRHRSLGVAGSTSSHPMRVRRGIWMGSPLWQTRETWHMHPLPSQYEL